MASRLRASIFVLICRRPRWLIIGKPVIVESHKPGLIHRAVKELDIDLARSAMVGDKDSDMQAALAAGIPHRYQVTNGEPLANCNAVNDLPDACRALLATA